MHSKIYNFNYSTTKSLRIKYISTLYNWGAQRTLRRQPALGGFRAGLWLRSPPNSLKATCARRVPCGLVTSGPFHARGMPCNNVQGTTNLYQAKSCRLALADCVYIVSLRPALRYTSTYINRIHACTTYTAYRFCLNPSMWRGRRNGVSFEIYI